MANNTHTTNTHEKVALHNRATVINPKRAADKAALNANHIAARKAVRRISARIALTSVGALLTVALIAVATSCGSDDSVNSDSNSSGTSDSLTLYSGRNEALIGPIIAQFEDATGVSVNVRYGNSADLALLIDEEGSASPADVYISQSPGAIGFLNENNRLRQLSQSVVSLLPETSRSADGTWVGITGRQRVLVYNPNLVDVADLPESVFALTEPEYSGRVAVAPQNGSFQDFITAMRTSLGDAVAAEWLEAMADNNSPNYAKNSAIVDAVTRGEVEMGLVNHYYLWRVLDEDPDAAGKNHYFAPDDIGSLVIVSGGAVLSSSDASGTAEELLKFLLSEEAQRYFADETREYPLVSGVSPSVGLPPLSELTTAALNFASLEGGLTRTVELIRDSGLEQ